MLQVSHFEKVYFSSLFMLGQTQLHPSFPTDMLLLGFSLSLGLVLIEMTLWILENDTVLSISIFEVVRQLSG